MSNFNVLPAVYCMPTVTANLLHKKRLLQRVDDYLSNG
jgi:hypothetical protein